MQGGLPTRTAPTLPRRLVERPPQYDCPYDTSTTAGEASPLRLPLPYLDDGWRGLPATTAPTIPRRRVRALPTNSGPRTLCQQLSTHVGSEAYP